MPRSLLKLNHAQPSDFAACHRLLKGGSRSFFWASHLLWGGVRDPAVALYAFCRLADDAIDQDGGDRETIAYWYYRVDSLYQGRPHPFAPDRALADVVAAYGIPKEMLKALIEGLEWDAQERRYEDLSALTAYGVRVAGSVGAMMAVIMGVSQHHLIARACDLGVAMQLTNIARDVGEDARMGRLYLPLDWLREAGIDPDGWMSDPRFSPELAAVVQRLLAAAEALYKRADPGIDQLPLGCRPGIYAARHLYAEIGQEVARANYDSVSGRAVVSPYRKCQRLVQVFASLVSPSEQATRSVLQEARFLLETVSGLDHGNTLNPPPWWQLGARISWVLELFISLEARTQAGVAQEIQEQGVQRSNG